MCVREGEGGRASFTEGGPVEENTVTQPWGSLYKGLETGLGRRVLRGKPGKVQDIIRRRMRFESHRLTVIDFQFADDQKVRGSPANIR